MRKIKHLLEYGGLRFVRFFVNLLPEGGVKPFANGIGWLACRVVGIRRRVALSNLHAAFPEKSPRELERLVEANYKNLALVAVEFLRQDKLSTSASERYEFNGLEILKKTVEQGRGAVLVMGHLANWETLGGALAQEGIPNLAIAEHMRNRSSDRLVESLRTSIGIGLHYTNDPAVRLIKGLRAGKVIGFLIDQDAGESGAFVDFFGRKASTAKGAALLALREKVPLLTCFTSRRDDGMYEATIRELQVDYDEGATEENIHTVTQQLTSMLEERIRELPEQWFWLHKRWKRRPPGEPEERRALLFQTAFLGDVILATSMAEALAQANPGWRIDFLTTPLAADVLRNNPHISEIITYDKRGAERGVSGFFKLRRQLKYKFYDIVIMPHRSMRSVLLASLAGIPRRIGFDRSAGSFLFTDVVKYRRNLHEVDRNLTLLAPLGAEASGVRPRLFPGKAEQKKALKLLDGLRKSGKRLVALAPGSIWQTKRWQADRYRELARKLTEDDDCDVVLIGSEADAQLCASVAEDRGSSLAGKTTPLESAAVLERCDLLVSNDSAPTHLAVSVGTPVIAIFGPTVPEFGFYPYGEDNDVISRELSCRPCAIHGGVKCPIGTFECMLEIPVSEVLKKVRQKLKQLAEK